MDNLEAVYTVLCDAESWNWDVDDEHKLIFHSDGTGEITSVAQPCIWIVAIFEWKVHDPTTVQFRPEQTRRSWIQGLSSSTEPPILRASIEFTLTKRRPLLFGQVVDIRRHINEHLLLDAAFEPRVLNITVKRGRFLSPSFGGNSSPDFIFQYRLTFDVSPYPAIEAWRPETHDMVESIGQPKMIQFCARRLPPEPAGCVVM
ncbi:hypothetical protein B0H16DRAFT_181553 [Mycena metata]|uniref:Uncharacterized protein n=1 Tax=Mycena metata TaxID=1033252 RepID=A0AAD7I1T7_9AGAR|nr:hypothetical protein B0H16DRAFT_181553 [Mycena metata]